MNRNCIGVAFSMPARFDSLAKITVSDPVAVGRSFAGGGGGGARWCGKNLGGRGAQKRGCLRFLGSPYRDRFTGSIT